MAMGKGAGHGWGKRDMDSKWQGRRETAGIVDERRRQCTARNCLAPPRPAPTASSPARGGCGGNLVAGFARKVKR